MSHEPLSAGTGRIAARLAKQVERALADLDLSLPQYRLMSSLSEGPSAASALAERLIVSRPSVTALADGLVERDLVARSHHATDRRSVMHVLTDKGLRVVAEADEAIERRLAALAAEISDPDRRRAFGGLIAWGKALDRAREKAVKSK